MMNAEKRWWFDEKTCASNFIEKLYGRPNWYLDCARWRVDNARI